MGALGERLRQARVDRQVTLQDAQRETRIHRRFLEALENEDIAALPAPVYTRGFIRTYADYLDLDPEAMVDLFHSIRGREGPPLIQPATTRIITPRPVSMRLLGIGTVSLVAVLLIGYMWSQYNSFVESVREADATPTPRATVQAAASPLPAGSFVGPAGSPGPGGVGSPVGLSPAPSPTPAPTPVRGVHVETRVTERTWLAVWVDNQSVLAQEVPAGFSQTFSGDQSVRMRVGNAAGVSVVVNGTSQGALGARGQVIDASWGR